MGKQVLFIDAGVLDQDALLDGLNPSIRVVRLPWEGDGLAHIARALAQHAPVDAVHIVCHGAPGKLYLGGGVVSQETLSGAPERLSAIAVSLAADADVRLYACECGNGAAGTGFVHALAAALGANVAAASRALGPFAAASGWELDTRAGVVSASCVLAPEALRAYPHRLAVSPDTLVNTFFTGDQVNHKMAALTGGGYVVVWETVTSIGLDIYAQRFDAGGNRVGVETKVNGIATSPQQGDQFNAGVTALSDGGYVVTWQSRLVPTGTDDVYAQRYAANGALVGTEVLVGQTTANSQVFPQATALDNGHYVVTWNSIVSPIGNELFVRAFDENNATVGADTQVNVFTADDQRFQQTTRLTDGNFVITWQSQNQDGSLNGVYARVYSEAGGSVTPLTGEFLVNTFTTANQEAPQIAALAGGGFVVTWQSQNQDGSLRGIYGQAYDNAGTAVGAEFQVNTYIPNDQIQPEIIALSGGGFVIAWESMTQDANTQGVYAKVFQVGAAGPIAGSEIQLNSYTLGDQGTKFTSFVPPYQNGLQLTALSDGGFVAIWQSNAQDTFGLGVYGQLYDATGARLGSEFRVAATTGGDQLNPQVSALAGGGFTVSWQGPDGNGQGIFTRTYPQADNDPILTASIPDQTVHAGWALNLKHGSNLIENLDPGDSLTYTASLADGTPLPAWLTYNPATMTFTGKPPVGVFDIRVTASDGDGTQVSDTFRLTSVYNGLLPGTETRVNTFTGGDQREPLVAGIGGQRYVVVWSSFNQDGSGDGVYGQVYAKDGTAIGSEFRVNATTNGNQASPSVAGLVNGGFVVTWDANLQEPGGGRGIYARQFDANGNPTTGEFHVNSTTADHQFEPTVTAIRQGGAIPLDQGYLITWTSNNQDATGTGPSGVFGQRYSSTGTPVGGEFQVNTFTANNQTNEQVVGLDNGGFVVTWQSNLQDGSVLGVYGQLFDNLNNPVGGEFQVNAFTANAQDAQQVIALPNGRFAVVWQSNLQDGGGLGIYTRTYSALGVASPETLVNVVTNNIQTKPHAATLSNGGYVVTWESFGQDASAAYGVYARVFGSNGAPIDGREVLVNTYTTDSQRNPIVNALPNGGFVVSWQSQGQDGNLGGIFAQVFDAFGNRVGVEFQVNTFTTGNQIFSDANTFDTGTLFTTRTAVLSDGSYVVTWTSSGQDGSGLGVYSKVFNPNEAPVANPDSGDANERGGVANGTPGTNATGNVLSNDTDANPGDTKLVTQVDGVAANVGIALAGDYGTLTLNADGSYTYIIDDDNIAVQALLTAANTLVDTFSYAVQDAIGATSTSTLSVTLHGANDAPAAVADVVTAVASGVAPGTDPFGDVLTNDVDVDAGDNKIVTTVNGAATNVAVWVDGTYGALVIHADGTYAYAVDNQSTAVQALRSNSDTLTESFDYTMRDTAGLTSASTLTVTIQGANDAPVAVVDSAVALEAGTSPGAPAVGNVLTNDTDVDAGDTKTVSAVEGDATNVGSALVGSYGTITINADGTFSYVVDDTNATVQALGSATDTLSESFDYTVVDTAGATSTSSVTVTINGANDAPEVTVYNGGITIAEGGERLLDGQAWFVSDPDSQASELTFTIVDAPDHGRIEAVANPGVALTSFALTDAVRYVHDGSEGSTDGFVFTVSDGQATTAPQTFDITVTPINDAPVLDVNTGASLDEGASIVLTAAMLHVSDADNASDQLSYGITAPAHGVIYRNTDGTVIPITSFLQAELDAGQISYRHDGSEGSTDGFVFTVSDGQATTAPQTFDITVTPVNDAPVITSEGGAATVNLTIAENATAVTTVTASDPDSATLQLSIAGGADAARFVLDAGNVLRFALAPDRENATDDNGDGIYEVKVQVSDGAGGTDEQTLIIDVSDVDEFDVGPVTDSDNLANTVAENSAVGAAVGIAAFATDADATTNTITYSLDDSAGGRFAIDATSGVVSVAGALDFEAAASHGIVVRATSADGSFSTAGFTITVTDVNEGNGLTLVGTPGNDILNGQGNDDSISGLGGNDTLNGNDGNDLLLGGEGNDIMNGGAGNDVLDGGLGADRMTGGTGDDTYHVDLTSDVVTEALNGGIDTVRTSLATYTLRAKVENLVYVGAANFTGKGNELDNRIDGGAGNDKLDGAAGNDTMAGGGGDDTYIVSQTGDLVVEADTAGTDLVQTTLNTYALTENVENLKFTGTGAFNGTGNLLDNRIEGSAGNDTLDGGDGNDTLLGNGGDDHLLGGNGNDTLTGGAGIDVLDGGDGDDTYSAVDSLDVIVESTTGGTDTVRTALTSYVLVANVENLAYTGSGAFTGVGNALDNRIDGGIGNDKLDGGLGSDVLAGGLGNDTYIVAQAGDQVVETNNAGSDTVQTAMAAYTLGDHVEKLKFTGAGAFDGTGNALDNQLDGATGNDQLSGLDGNDILNGATGNDTLLGGEGNDILSGAAGTDILDSGNGNDTLNGGANKDDMTGGDGNDIFVFNASIAEIGNTAATRDLIRDFDGVGVDPGDVLNFSAIDANTTVTANQAFSFLDTAGAAFTGAGQLRYYYSGGNTIIEGNVNASLAADFQLELTSIKTFDPATDLVL